jgi:hypothetical protein
MNNANRIWVTRKCRINASERLKNNDLFSQILIAYYSLFIIITTIIDMKNDHINFEVLTLALSIFILVASVFVLAMNYKERSLKLQTAYIKLNKIYREVEKKEATEEDFTEHLVEYDNVLECSENHAECDYLKVMFEVRNDPIYKDINPKFTYDKYVQYSFCKVKDYFLLALFISGPFIILFSFAS